jgi:LysR family glycine cleavage system transcriptional activator
MRRQIPSLTAIRAFESAAHHGSFTKAAQDLAVTQGAISRQIRALEAFLGVELFERLTRKVVLTEAGRQYQLVIARAFDEVEQATARLRGGARRRVLRISVLPTISSFWLMPRLAAFAQIAPDVELRIINSIEPVDFQGKAADLAIRVGRLPGESFQPDRPRVEMDMVTAWEGVRSEFLFRDVLVPICSPRLIDGHVLQSVDDLREFPLIHVTTRRYAWHDWLKAHRVDFDPSRNARYFGHFFMAMEAARAGQGIAIVPTILLRHYDNASQVVCPFKPDLSSAGGYYLLHHESQAGDGQLKKLRRWISDEAAAARAAMSPADREAGPPVQDKSD